MFRCFRDAGLAGLLMRAAALLPLDLLHGLGTVMGVVSSWFPNRLREVSRRNLELCLPELTEGERARLLRRSLIETGKVAMETPLIWCGRPERVLNMVKGISGGRAVDQAMAEGRGVVVAGPHLGAWEVLGLYLGARYPISALFRPPRNSRLEKLIHAGRERTGGQLVATDTQGVRALFRRLTKGEMVGILPDQDPGYKSGIFVPFFGIPTITMILASRLAQKQRPLVVIGYAERLPSASGYHIHFVPVGEAIYDQDTTVSASALNHAIEEAIRSLPTQYQWSYKRFRRRPRDEDPDLYAGLERQRRLGATV